MGVERLALLTDLLRRWREGFPASLPATAASAALDRDPDTVLVDPRTRTFWSRATGTSTTLVEATDHDDGAVEVDSLGRRVAALLAARDAPPPPPAEPVDEPEPDPGRSEERFVELLRDGRYEAAFGLLAAPCQERWGSARAFAAGQGSGAANLLGLSVRGVRRLPDWADAEGGCVHRDVVELDVDYRVRLSATATATVSRTVHLVAAGGGWRSICYPTR
jgi:hypothetical protein